MLPPPDKTLRQRVADEAARLIYEEGFRDYRLAKQKAAQRMGASSQSKQQPGNEEVLAALHEYIRLLDVDDEHRTLLRHHREIAVEALGFLQDFQPYLTGSALEGVSGPHSAVTLHLSANRAEDVIFFMEEQNIPFQVHERKIRSGKKQAYFPLLRFYADDVEVELMIFPDDGRSSHAALDPLTGKGIRRADLKKVQALLQDTDKKTETDAINPAGNSQ